MDVIKVSANSRTSAVAGAVAGVIREHHRAEVQAIGAGAVNQAVKALVLATGYLKNDGIDVACVPEFADVAIDAELVDLQGHGVIVACGRARGFSRVGTLCPVQLRHPAKAGIQARGAWITAAYRRS